MISFYQTKGEVASKLAVMFSESSIVSLRPIANKSRLFDIIAHINTLKKSVMNLKILTDEDLRVH